MNRDLFDLTGRERVIICGTRGFADFDLLKRKMDKITFFFENPVIITGGNKEWSPKHSAYVGADILGEKWGHRNHYLVQTFWPDWDKYGKPAGPIRNREMAEHASKGKGPGYCVAFWNGKSSGTADMIKQAKFYDLRLRIVRVKC